MKGNEACARKCVRKGSPAVLLAPDSRVCKLEQQTKLMEHAGHKVNVTGTLNGDTMKVEKISSTPGARPDRPGASRLQGR